MRCKVFSMLAMTIFAYLITNSIVLAESKLEKIPITEETVIGKWEAEWKTGKDSGTILLTINDTESINYRVKSNVSGKIWKFKNRIQKFDRAGIECGKCNKTITDTYELFKDEQGKLLLKGDCKIIPLEEIVEIKARKIVK
jgi:hypothetical protein